MKKLLFLTLISSLVLSGCGNRKSRTEIVDPKGNSVSVPLKIERIISTAPSGTEIIIGLGLGRNLVAVDSYSPLEDLRDDVEIIKFQNPDIEHLISLNPDVVVISGHSGVGDEKPYKQLEDIGIATVYIHSAESLNDIVKNIDFLGKVLSREKESKDISSHLESEIEKIRTTAAEIETRKRVYFEIGDYNGQLYTFGLDTFLGEALSLVGAENIFSDMNSWVSISAESVISKNPDIIVSNMSYVDNLREKIASRPGFNVIQAVINRNIYEVDEDRTSRGSQHIIKGIKEIAEAVYPDIYSFE